MALVVAFVALLGLLALSVLPATLRARTADGRGRPVRAGALRCRAGGRPAGVRRRRALPRPRVQFLFVTVREPEITLLDWLVGEGLSPRSACSATPTSSASRPPISSASSASR